jgi:hypothetical protein
MIHSNLRHSYSPITNFSHSRLEAVRRHQRRVAAKSCIVYSCLVVFLLLLVILALEKLYGIRSAIKFGIKRRHNLLSCPIDVCHHHSLPFLALTQKNLLFPRKSYVNTANAQILRDDGNPFHLNFSSDVIPFTDDADQRVTQVMQSYSLYHLNYLNMTTHWLFSNFLKYERCISNNRHQLKKDMEHNAGCIKVIDKVWKTTSIALVGRFTDSSTSTQSELN